MYRRILVPVDGSSLSEYAIPFAVEIARRGKGEVRLLRAMPESLIVTDIPVSVQASVRKIAQTDMEKLKKAFDSKEVPVSTDLRIGFPVEEVLRAATKSDLVVMTTHGRGGLARWVMGSVADKVVRLAAKPVLALHPPAKKTLATAQAAALRMFRDIAVPLDGSTLAERALAELKQFATSDAKLHFVRVVAQTASASAVDLATNYLRDEASKFEARGIRITASVLKSDNPAEAICDYAVKSGCGMIAMATHGASGLTRWVLGGVTDKVMRHGPTPVMVIRWGRPLWKDGKRPLGAAVRESKGRNIALI
ncbi:MAG: universal stress protein [Planctomycetes bacterium]|nr:universal stress protein [Planctomycetota bacterium]